MTLLHPQRTARRPGRAPRCASAPLALALLLALALPGGARAAVEAIDLTWNDCVLGGGTANVNANCAAALTPQALVASFSLAAPVDSVIAAEIVVDVQSAATTIPPWWDFSAGGCDDGMLTASVDFSQMPGCADAWGGHGAAQLLGVQLGQPRGAGSQERITASAFVPSDQAQTLASGPFYDAVTLLFDFFRNGSCAGCASPACLVLNSIRLRRLPPAADVLLVTPGDGSANWATWLGGTGADCTAVPARARSWGQIKTLYR